MSVTRACPSCGYTHTYTTEQVAAAHHPRHSCTRHQRRGDTARRRAQRAADGPKRPCRHHGNPHRHGTRTAYVNDRCRCVECTAANTAASSAAARERTFGRWNPFVDATPVRQHIHTLRREGIGIQQLAKLTGLSARHLRDLAEDSHPDRPVIQKVRPETAEHIMAVEPTDANRAPGTQVDATGTRRRLHALVAVGWSQSRLAAELRRGVTNLNRSMTGESVTLRTAQRVSDLYDRLWDQAPPQATAAQRNAVQAARSHARQRNWPPPLAWDDIDTDTDPDPSTPPSPPGADDDLDDLDDIAIERAIAGDGIRLEQLNPAEQAEVVRRLTERGKSIREIADQLATTKRTVSRRRVSAASAA